MKSPRSPARAAVLLLVTLFGTINNNNISANAFTSITSISGSSISSSRQYHYPTQQQQQQQQRLESVVRFYRHQNDGEEPSSSSFTNSDDVPQRIPQQPRITVGRRRRQRVSKKQQQHPKRRREQVQRVTDSTTNSASTSRTSRKSTLLPILGPFDSPLLPGCTISLANDASQQQFLQDWTSLNAEHSLVAVVDIHTYPPQPHDHASVRYATLAVVVEEGTALLGIGRLLLDLSTTAAQDATSTRSIPKTAWLVSTTPEKDTTTIVTARLLHDIAPSSPSLLQDSLHQLHHVHAQRMQLVEQQQWYPDHDGIGALFAARTTSKPRSLSLLCQQMRQRLAPYHHQRQQQDGTTSDDNDDYHHMLLTWTALSTFLSSSDCTIDPSQHIAWAVRCTDPVARSAALVDWMQEHVRTLQQAMHDDTTTTRRR